jgi:hypothetical protein
MWRLHSTVANLSQFDAVWFMQRHGKASIHRSSKILYQDDALMMEAVCISEASVNFYESTYPRKRCHRHTHRRENLKSHFWDFIHSHIHTPPHSLAKKWRRVWLTLRIDDGELYSILCAACTHKKSNGVEVPRTEHRNTTKWTIRNIPHGTLNIYDAATKGKKVFLSWQYWRNLSIN